ncbi:hypothetical protein BJ684DRAFT_14885 [Piptocephalis cylindrospora]|uniref:Uncharacterized protein n=1 Tax=Piptocephalis cylindrospora TaxID=1907219 RepID=A0A4P9Y6Z6_9FUNG|nr:hypothetical protein BJ684DRAFT_14885 [Piptocephalis cylindrospora]|eukprot:RKP14815.1 hypothetical protein BJ684DRAFT_14885 [Piptocephalis cylindrospora]
MSISSGTASQPPLSRFTSTAYSSPASAATAVSPEGAKSQGQQQSSWALPYPALTGSPEPMGVPGVEEDTIGQEHLFSHSSFLQDAPYLVDHLSYGSPPASISSEWPSLGRFDRANELMADIDALMAAADDMRVQADGPGLADGNLSQRPIPEGYLEEGSEGEKSLEDHNQAMKEVRMNKGKMPAQPSNSSLRSGSSHSPVLHRPSSVMTDHRSITPKARESKREDHSIQFDRKTSNEGDSHPSSLQKEGPLLRVQDHDNDLLLPAPGWTNDLTPIHSLVSAKVNNTLPTAQEVSGPIPSDRVKLAGSLSPSPPMPPQLVPSPLIPDVWEITGMTPLRIGPEASEDEAEIIRQQREALPPIQSLPERSSQRELESALERLKTRVSGLESEREHYLSRLRSIEQDMLQATKSPESDEEVDVSGRMARTLSKLLTAETEIIHHEKEREELLGKVDDLRHHLEMAERYLGEADEDIQTGKALLEDERARVDRWKGRCKALVESIKHRDMELTRREERMERREARIKRRARTEYPSPSGEEAHEVERLRERCRVLERQAEYAGFKLQALKQERDAERQRQREDDDISRREDGGNLGEGDDGPSKTTPQTFLLDNYPLLQEDVGSEETGPVVDDGEEMADHLHSQLPTPIASGGPIDADRERVTTTHPLSPKGAACEDVGVQTEMPYLVLPSREDEQVKLGSEKGFLRDVEGDDNIIQFPDLRGLPLYEVQGQSGEGALDSARFLKPITCSPIRQVGGENRSGSILGHPKPFRVGGAGSGKNHVSFSVSENLRRVSDLLDQEKALRSGKSMGRSSGGGNSGTYSATPRDKTSECTVCGSGLVPLTPTSQPGPIGKGGVGNEGRTNGLSKALGLLEEDFEEMRELYQDTLAQYEDLLPRSADHGISRNKDDGRDQENFNRLERAERKGLALKLYGLLEGLERKGEQIMAIHGELPTSLLGSGGATVINGKSSVVPPRARSPWKSTAGIAQATPHPPPFFLGGSDGNPLPRVSGSGSLGGRGLVAGVAGIRRRMGIELLRTARAVQVAYQER